MGIFKFSSSADQSSSVVPSMYSRPSGSVKKYLEREEGALVCVCVCVCVCRCVRACVGGVSSIGRSLTSPWSLLLSMYLIAQHHWPGGSSIQAVTLLRQSQGPSTDWLLAVSGIATTALIPAASQLAWLGKKEPTASEYW